MKREILVPVITSKTQGLVAQMNSQVRMINLMIDQLYAHHENIEEQKRYKEEYPARREKLARAISEKQKRYQEQCDKIEALEEEVAGLDFLEFAKRVKLARELKAEKDKLAEMKTSLLRSCHILNKKDDQFAHIDIDIEKVLLPNYKNHLAKFYHAVREYRRLANQFTKLSGVSVPDIEVDKIMLFNGERGEFPEVNIDYIVPSLELELDYDYYEEKE